GAKQVVLALQLLDVPRVVERDRRDAGDDRDETQLIFVEVRAGVCRCQVDDADGATEEHERHAHERAYARGLEALGRTEAALDDVVGENGALLSDDLSDDCAAHFDRARRLARALQTELCDRLSVFAGEKYRAAL